MSGADDPEAQPAADPDRPGRPGEAPPAAADRNASGSADAGGKAQDSDATASKPATEGRQHAARDALEQLSSHFASFHANIFNAPVNGSGATFGTSTGSGQEDGARRPRTGTLTEEETGAVRMPLDDHPATPQSAHPGLRTRSLVLLAIGLAAIVYAVGMVIVRPDRGLSAASPPHPTTSRSTASSSRPTASHSPRPDPPATFPPTPVPTHSPARRAASSLSPAVSVIPFQAANPYFDYDPQGVAGSEVMTGFYACYAWLDNYGSGDLSGAIYAGTGSCAGEVFRSGGPTVNLTASYEGERTSALSDIGHKMRICVWPQNNQADEQCSPWFGMNGDTPVQR